VQLMHFFHAMKQSHSPIVNGTPVRSFGWEDDGEDGLALRVISEDDKSILIYNTDKITRPPKAGNMYTVSIGATDHQFVLG
jgi:hypothetical protein